MCCRTGNRQPVDKMIHRNICCMCHEIELYVQIQDEIVKENHTEGQRVGGVTWNKLLGREIGMALPITAKKLSGDPRVNAKSYRICYDATKLAISGEVTSVD